MTPNDIETVPIESSNVYVMTACPVGFPIHTNATQPNMWNLKRPTIQPIGLDLGHDSVKLLQLQVLEQARGDNQGRRLSAVAAAKHAIPNEARTNPAKRVELSVPVIARLLAQQPFAGRNVVATLPREMVHIKSLRLPLLPTGELAAAVRSEVSTVFPFNIDEARIEFLPAGEVRQGNEHRQEVIVIGVKHRDIDLYLQQLDHCRVVVQALDIEITGIFRSFERFDCPPDEQLEAQMIIDIGARRSQVVIGKGGDINFYKPVQIGGLHLLNAIARKLGITLDEARALRHRLLDSEESVDQVSKKRDPVRQAVHDACRSVAEELGKELAMCLRYFMVTFRGHRPTRARLIGGEAADPQLRSIIQSALNIPVESANPLEWVDTSRMTANDRRGSMPQWALAMGLSLRFVKGHFSSLHGRQRTMLEMPVQTQAEASIADTPLLNDEVVHV